MAHTSWTGRAGKGQPRKIPLSKYANVVKLICDICCKADHDYSHERCLDDFKYKIIKYAHSKFSVEKGVETCNASQPIAPQPIAPQPIAPQPAVCESDINYYTPNDPSYQYWQHPHQLFNYAHSISNNIDVPY